MEPQNDQPKPTVIQPLTDQAAGLPVEPTNPVNDTTLTDETLETEEQDSGAGSAIKEALSTIGILAAALLVALGLIAFVFQSYQVSGPSMESTLQDQDRLIVWKFPRSWAKVTGEAYIPNRGDVIIFNEGNLPQFGAAENKQLIKRVMALPGERVVVANNTITVFNKEHPDGFEPDKTLPYGKNITEPAEQNVEYTVGDNQVFVAGDNRTNSLDSRFFGPINSDQIVGKLVLRVLPLSNAERF